MELVGTSGKEPANEGDIRDLGLISLKRRSAGGQHDNPLQYSCLENPTDRGAWWATAHGVTESQTRLKQISKHALTGHVVTGLPSIIIGAAKERSRAGFRRRVDSPHYFREVTFQLQRARGRKSVMARPEGEHFKQRHQGGWASEPGERGPAWDGVAEGPQGPHQGRT